MPLPDGQSMPLRATVLASLLTQRGVVARVVGDGEAVGGSLANFDEAGPLDITFIRTSQLAAAWADAKGGITLISEKVAGGALGPAAGSQGRALLVVPDADLALIEVLTLLSPPPAVRQAGVQAGALVHPQATLGTGVHVSPGAVVEANAVIDDHCVLLAGSYVGPQARVGRHTLLHPGARVLERCVVGSECILHSGSVIGADGFGYRPRVLASGQPGLLKVPHIGIVEVGDDVEIGANSCIDRAKFGSTVVGSGTKIDNLVQVAHNCRIGRCCILCGEVGLAGSVTLGDGVVLGAKVGIADNLTIGRGARIGAGSGVMTDVPAGATFLGTPAMPAIEAKRAYVRWRQMGRGER